MDQREKERRKEGECIGGGGKGRDWLGVGAKTEVWIIAAQWRLCLISEVSRPI